jgi:glycosyltransferase involved in cell wall biosynthesis
VQDPAEAGFFGFVIAQLAHAKLHVQVHTDFLSPEYKKFTKRNLFHLSVAGFVLRRATRIRVVSEKIKQTLMSRYAPQVPITVLPIFVDIEKFKQIQHQKHPQYGTVLLCVGRLAKEKNFDVAVRAVRDARAEGHDVGLIIVGNGPQEEALKEEVRTYELQGFVTFPGFQTDVTPYYAVADLLLVPSEYEGYGMIIVEALAAGIPVFSTDVGVARESGAMIVEKHHFSDAIREWLVKGVRRGELKHYPCSSFEEYRRKFCDDILACRQHPHSMPLP